MDNIFLLVFALVQERDIVVIPVHRDTASSTIVIRLTEEVIFFLFFDRFTLPNVTVEVLDISVSTGFVIQHHGKCTQA